MSKIIFTKKNITQDKIGGIELEVEKFIPLNKGVEVEKIFFNFEDDKTQWESCQKILSSKKTDGTDNQVFELEFDDSKVKTIVIKPERGSMSLSSESKMESKREISVRIYEERKLLNIDYESSLIALIAQTDASGQLPKVLSVPEAKKVNQQKNADFSQKPANSQPEKIDKIKESGKLAEVISPENQSKVEEIIDELAANPEKLAEAVQGKIENQMSISGVDENELSSTTKSDFNQLKNGEIKDSTKIKEIEEEVTREVSKLNVDKKITNLRNQINEILGNKNKGKDNEEKAKEIKNLLANFIANENSYFQVRKSEAQALEKQLENYLNQNNPSSQNNSDFPWKVVVPVSLLSVLVIIGIVIVKRNKSKKLK